MLARTAYTLLICCCALLPGHLAAEPALVFDAANGKIIYAEDLDDQWHPASLTKIMTAYLAFEAIKEGKLSLEGKIACSANAHKEPASKVGLPVGAEMSVSLALDALIVKSANDVAVMLAEAIGGTEAQFVAKMNATARRLGMTRTHFANPNGLPASTQVTTARDLAKLSQAVLRDFPEYNHLWSKQYVRIGKRRLGTHNGLLKTFEGADGLKTGFICDSGYNVVASATREGRRLMAVVLGARSSRDRTIRAASLLEHGFRSYGWKMFFNTDSIDSRPMSVSADAATSIRKTVRNGACGYRGVASGRGKRALTKAQRIRAARIRRAKAKNNTADKSSKSAAKTAKSRSKQKSAQASNATAKKAQ